MALLVAGCVATPRPEVDGPNVTADAPEPTADARKATIAEPEVTAAQSQAVDDGEVASDFRIQGRIAVRGASEAFSASFDWRQAGDHYEIEFWGPLGQGRMRVSGDAATARVTDARGRITGNVRPQTLLQRELGWSAPLDALRYWVRGQHDPAAAVHAERHDADGRPAGFEQFGWAVELSRWRTVAAGAVPAKIVATRGDNRIALVCREWWIGH